MNIENLSEAARAHLISLGFGASVFILPEKARTYRNLERFTGIPKKRLKYLAATGRIPFIKKSKHGYIEFKIADALEWAVSEIH